MSNTWTYPEEVYRPGTDLAGFDVEATDGGIGKVDENSIDRDHLIVDTGFWIFGHKRLIPAGVVTAIDYDAETVHVNLTKDQVREAPDIEATLDRTRDDWDRHPYTSYFGLHSWR